MKSRTPMVVGGVLCLLIGVAGGIFGTRWWQNEHADHQAEKSEGHAEVGGEESTTQGVALVRTAVAVEGDVHRTIEALGATATPVTATTIISCPTDIIVSKILVLPNQAIDKGAPLVQVTVTKDIESQITAATQATHSAANAREVVQERLNRGLATRAELLAAESVEQEATQRLNKLQAALPPSDGLLRAPSESIVAAVRVQPGATITAGNPILDLSSPSEMVALLGVEPSDVIALAVGQSVNLVPIDANNTARYEGTISLIAQSINSSSRLIDVTVAISKPPLPPSGLALRGIVSLPDIHSVIISRAALLTDGEDMVIFTVHDGKAVRSKVTVAWRASDHVAVSSGCNAGDRVVIMGQGQLEDGAPVREERSHEDGPSKGADGGD